MFPWRGTLRHLVVLGLRPDFSPANVWDLWATRIYADKYADLRMSVSIVVGFFLRERQPVRRLRLVGE